MSKPAEYRHVPHVDREGRIVPPLPIPTTAPPDYTQLPPDPWHEPERF